MSISHSFSVDVAKKHGVDVAIMLNHFAFWYIKNKSDNHQFFKNDYWVRMKASALREYFPYYSVRQLRYIIDRMIDFDLLKQDEFNQKKNDRTKWYSLTKNSKKLLNISSDKNVTNVSHKIVTPTDKNVTSIKEDNKYIYTTTTIAEKISNNHQLLEIIAMQTTLKIDTIKSKINEFELHCVATQKTHSNDGDLFGHFSSWIRKLDLKDEDVKVEFEWFLKMFNAVANKKFVSTDETKRLFAVQLSNGFTGAQMRKAVENLYSSSVDNKFHKESSFKFATPEYLLKGDNLNRYLNLKYK